MILVANSSTRYQLCLFQNCAFLKTSLKKHAGHREFNTFLTFSLYYLSKLIFIIVASNRDNSMRQIDFLQILLNYITPNLPTPGNKNAKTLKDARYQLTDEDDKYCCALTYEIMNDPVIDPTTLIAGIDPSTNKPFINPSKPEHFSNYHNVPRYERKSLEDLIGIDGVGKSPNTRLEFTAAGLMPDPALQSVINTFVNNIVEKYERSVTHHVFGELYFKIEESDSGLSSHKMRVILKNKVVNNTGMGIPQDTSQFLLSHCDVKNIFVLEDFFSGKGYTAEIIKQVIENYRKSLTHHVVGNLSFMIEPTYIKDGFLKQRISLVKNREIFLSVTFGNRDIAQYILSANGNLTQLKINLAGIPTFVMHIENAEAEIPQNQTCGNSASPAGMFGTARTQAQPGSTTARGPSFAPLD